MNSTQLYDVLFLDITVSNLLSAVTILERFEGIKIKVPLIMLIIYTSAGLDTP